MSDENTEGTGEKVVPYDRFQAVVSQKNAAATEAAKLKTEVQALTEKAATAETLARQLEQDRTQFASERNTWVTERALMTHGLLDQEARDVALLHYGRLPEKDRPALDTWVTGLRADPTTAPRSLQPFLGSQASNTAAAAGATGQAQRQTSTRAGADASAASAATGEPLSAAKLREVRQAAERSGDWTTWKRLTSK